MRRKRATRAAEAVGIGPGASGSKFRARFALLASASRAPCAPTGYNPDCAPGAQSDGRTTMATITGTQFVARVLLAGALACTAFGLTAHAQVQGGAPNAPAPDPALEKAVAGEWRTSEQK